MPRCDISPFLCCSTGTTPCPFSRLTGLDRTHLHFLTEWRDSRTSLRRSSRSGRRLVTVAQTSVWARLPQFPGLYGSVSISHPRCKTSPAVSQHGMCLLPNSIVSAPGRRLKPPNLSAPFISSSQARRLQQIPIVPVSAAPHGHVAAYFHCPSTSTLPVQFSDSPSCQYHLLI